jgi:hypothetical protein
MTIYLSIDELIQINLEMVGAFGGTAGVRGLRRVTTETSSKRERLCVKAFFRTILLSMETRGPRSARQPFSMK